MKVKTIHIELEPDEDTAGHATIIDFKDGMWKANGPLYPRISGALQAIYDMLRGRKGPSY